MKTPITWTTRPLGELLQVQNGFAFASDRFTKEGGIRLIRIRDLKSGTDTETRYDGPFDDDFLVNAGDLLIGMDGEFKCYQWKGQPALLNQRVCRLRGFESEIIPEFVLFGINAHLKVIEDNTPFVTVRHLSAKSINKINFSYPLLNEQTRIVGRIRECFSHVEEINSLNDSACADTQHLPQAFRYDLWNECNDTNKAVELGNVAASVKNGLYKPKKFYGSGSLFIRMFNINGGQMVFDKEARVQASDSELTQYALQAGDILVSRVNSRELVGKSAVVSPLPEPAVFEAMIMRLRVDKAKVLPSFLSALMNAPQFLHSLRQRAKHAIGQSSINQGDLLSSLIPLPPMRSQSRWVEEFSAFQAAALPLHQECISQAQHAIGLKEAILRKAFAGEL